MAMQDNFGNLMLETASLAKLDTTTCATLMLRVSPRQRMKQFCTRVGTCYSKYSKNILSQVKCSHWRNETVFCAHV